MDFLLALTNWLKEMLVGGIMGNLSGMFDSVNQQVGDIATQVGDPQGWNAGHFQHDSQLSESSLSDCRRYPYDCDDAGADSDDLDRNNLHDVDTWIFFKWVFKTCRCHPDRHQHMEYRHGVFDVAQSVVAQRGIIGSDTPDISGVWRIWNPG